MVLEGKYAKKAFLYSSLILGINVVSHLHFKDSGEDVVGYIYMHPSLSFNSKSGSYLESQLMSLWLMTSSITLQSSTLRVMTSFLLLVGVLKQDPILRLPWIMLSVLEVQGNALLLFLTWILLLFHCQIVPVQGLSLLVTVSILYLRLTLWEQMCWFTLNDIVSIVSWVYQQHATLEVVERKDNNESAMSATTADFLFDDAAGPSNNAPGPSHLVVIVPPRL